ncbi:YqeG family HAD IIIA-type phosphatase ['Cynodon dactylon' phytoplasma]|uniref:YqeG family HAD IIIA-type phosphatase n=1 Tax='Cynodon dactylon' phytoplasma TaxID=295320 RepID=UPI001265D0FD|nr:YqeG family HAD IIIA-type phosphatase ['Cynodon dactylon' phytoplasma]KAB8121890.1 YqeG family HAD IIIA-type phosphatase ['Cynodon dactylon' phytoplasma]
MNKKIKKYLPNFYYKNFFDIPYDFFAKKGIKALIFDLDNTLLSSSDSKLNSQTIKKMKEIQEKFKIFILSNSSKKKLKKVFKFNFFNYIYLKWYQKKPFLYGFKKILSLLNVNHDQVLMIGDQLITDILGSNKMNIKSILVKPIDRKNEFFFTKFNRFLFEYPIISYTKKNYPHIYKEKFLDFIK